MFRSQQGPAKKPGSGTIDIRRVTWGIGKNNIAASGGWTYEINIKKTQMGHKNSTCHMFFLVSFRKDLDYIDM